MEDHHKFRVWNELDKLYMDTGTIFTNIDGSLFIKFFLSIHKAEKILPDYPLVRENCTGLKDKNGKLYFSGDLYKDYEGKTHEVKPWHEMDNSNLFIGCCDEWEIIGNIHTTPELLND